MIRPMRLWWLPAALMLFIGTATLAASPVKGVVWVEPADAASIRADLFWMKRAGIQAVRTGIVANDETFRVADRLGITIYQELPFVHYAAQRMVDSLASALKVLDRVVARSRAHPSARHIGLVYGGETNQPGACRFIRALTDRVHETLGREAVTYYTTVLPDLDRCAGSADLVLVELRGYLPNGVPQHWRVARQAFGKSRLGVAAIGRRVAGEPKGGLLSPYSEASQARYLEDGLGFLLRDGPEAPEIVFVYRWRDVEGAEAIARQNPLDRSYGLIAPDGNVRPAYYVMAGLYTGRQTVFAFPRGSVPPSATPWFMIIGWVVILSMVLFVAYSPRVRMMIPRYFRAHGFYRDAVREGRDLLMGSSVVGLVAISVSVGIILAVLINASQSHQAFVAAFGLVPAGARQVVETLLELPLMILLVGGSLYAVDAILWSSILAMFSTGRYRLQPGQALMLVVWPRWPLLLLIVAGMATSGLPLPELRVAALGLAACWIGFSILSFMRTVYDYYEVTRVPILYALLAAMLNPSIMLLLAAGGAMLFFVPETQYLITLITGR